MLPNRDCIDSNEALNKNVVRGDVLEVSAILAVAGRFAAVKAAAPAAVSQLHGTARCGFPRALRVATPRVAQRLAIY